MVLWIADHMVPRAMLGLEVVTMKTEAWVLTLEPLHGIFGNPEK